MNFSAASSTEPYDPSDDGEIARLRERDGVDNAIAAEELYSYYDDFDPAVDASLIARELGGN